ncbi:MAG: Rne/Rng family ribonuclease [Deltaproteobacteria bacterium]|jgi:ribonuclease G|nr:Rne/Rng family ribonuclease [Deltaproteobacteria bacterium]
MSNTLLLINADGPETRVALVEDGLLGELYIERKQERGIAGNIYKGRVERVLPGMQAAFVNIGLEKSAYLHVSDVRGAPDDLKRLVAVGESSGHDSAEDEEPEAPSGSARIEDLLKEGQEIAVQVTKEPISTKGARVTRYISLPGRHLVFMPTVEHVGISRRISSDKERKRLREIIDQMRPAGTGFIVRTVAENVPEKDLRADMDFLIKLWNNVVQRTEAARCPSLIYNDLDLLLRTVRDMFTPDVDKLIIDSRPDYERIKKFIHAFMPDFAGQIELYTSSEPIFDGYGIEIEIDRALERKVWLKSGGYLIVDEMEALTAIDVNTGRFVGKRNLEDTITQTNLEAAREVAEQLRIRSIGGMIVVDFIDMDRASNRNKVTRAFNDFLRRDRAKAAVTRISELGLVEMTRKRTRESLLHHLTEPCEHCEGKGYTKSRRTVAYGLLRELRRQGNLVEGDTVLVEVHPDVAQVLAGPDHVYLEEMEKRLQKRIAIKARGSFALEDFEIRSPGQKAIERSDAGRDDDRPEARRHRRRKKVGPPAEVQAMLDADERESAAEGQDAEDAEARAAVADGDAGEESMAGTSTRSSDGAAAEAAPSEPPELEASRAAGSEGAVPDPGPSGDETPKGDS